MSIAGKLSIIAVVCAGIMLSSAAAGAEKKIGVLMYSEETRYHEALKGIKEQLEKGGFKEPEVRFIMENAEGSKAKTAELVRKFAELKLDMILTVGTTATVAVVREIKDVPIVFSMVYDPVEAGIAKDWKSSGNNITGASPRIPMSRLVTTLKKFAPVKNLAVLYTPGEKNSEIQLKELQGLQTEFKIKIMPVILTSREEIDQTLSTVVHSVDAVYLSGSSIVGTSTSLILDITTGAKVITIAHLDDLVNKGALLGVCADPYLVGRLAGKKAVQILRGAKPSSIPIEIEKKLDVILNKKTALAGQFVIPPEFMKTVTKTVE